LQILFAYRIANKSVGNKIVGSHLAEDVVKRIEEKRTEDGRQGTAESRD